MPRCQTQSTGSSANLPAMVYQLLPPIAGQSLWQPPGASALHAIPLEPLQEFLEQSNARLDRWLTEGERQLLAGFSLKKRRLEWLGGRLSAKVALLSLLNGPGLDFSAKQLEILPDGMGRPHLISLGEALPEEIFFSISHSGCHAAALASLRRPCGLDIQQPASALTGIKERFSTAAERRLLQSCPQLAQLDTIKQLALLWSAKEAFRKALSLSPLPAFLETRLTAKPQAMGGAFHLTAAFNRQGHHRNFSVTAWLHNGLAVAITFV